MNKKIKLVYPDSLYDINSISCASFLYFEKGQIGITNHPTVSLFLSGCDPIDFLKFTEEKTPTWKQSYNTLFGVWRQSYQHLSDTNRLLKHMRELEIFKSIWLIYPKNEEALTRSEDFIRSTGLSIKELFNLINIEHAAQELMAHLHFEMILEIYGEPEEKNPKEFIKREVDYKYLLNYCDKFFKNNSFEEALVKAYFFRLNAVNDFDNFMLSNERLIPLLSKLNQSEMVDKETDIKDSEDTIDVVSWEIFRQLVSPYLDEKEIGYRLSTTIDSLQMREEEIKNLKNKCLMLAMDFKDSHNLPSLKENVANYVARHVETDIQDLFALDRDTFKEIKDKIFSDEKTWFSLLTFITSLYTGGELITAGAGLATISNVIAKSYQTKAEVKKSIKKSDYALLYRIKKSY